MKQLTKILITGALTTVCLQAQTYKIDFEQDSNSNNLTSGQIIDDEYASGIPSTTISVSGGSADIAVIFDTENPTGGDDVTDLTKPYQQGNIKDSADPKNLLIIQENGMAQQNGFVSEPADDAAGGGFIKFVFAPDQQL